MNTYKIKASLFHHSVEFEVEAISLGEALNEADRQFREIYCKANGLTPEQTYLTWGSRKVTAKAIKKATE